MGKKTYNGKDSGTAGNPLRSTISHHRRTQVKSEASFRWEEKQEGEGIMKVSGVRQNNYVKYFLHKLINFGFTKKLTKSFEEKHSMPQFINLIGWLKYNKEMRRSGPHTSQNNMNIDIKAVNQLMLLGSADDIHYMEISEEERKNYSKMMRMFANKIIREVILKITAESSKLRERRKKLLYYLLFQMHRTRSEQTMRRTQVVYPE